MQENRMELRMETDNVTFALFLFNWVIVLKANLQISCIFFLIKLYIHFLHPQNNSGYPVYRLYYSAMIITANTLLPFIYISEYATWSDRLLFFWWLKILDIFIFLAIFGWTVYCSHYIFNCGRPAIANTFLFIYLRNNLLIQLLKHYAILVKL